MVIIGLTGLIATGKTNTQKIISKYNNQISVFDADLHVDNLLSTNIDIILSIKRIAPSCFISNKINKNKLSDLAFKDKKLLRSLEKIIHPTLRNILYDFLRRNLLQNKKATILDIPLLFESGIDNICDYIIVTKCSKIMQSYRYVKRGNDKKKLKSIIDRQSLDILKEKKANLIINTNIAKNNISSIDYKIIDKILIDARDNTGYRNYGFKHKRWR